MSAARRIWLLPLTLAALSAPYPGAPAMAQDEAPKLPAYFTSTSADESKPTWPDAGGGASGVWTTPAGDGKGDVPANLSVQDAYPDFAIHVGSKKIAG